MTAQRIRSGSDASGIPVPLSKVLPQRLAEPVHQIRFIADRARNTKDLTFPHIRGASRYALPTVPGWHRGVRALNMRMRRQLMRHLVGPVRQSIQIEPAPILHQFELPQGRGAAGRRIERLGEPVSAVHIELAAPQARAGVVDRSRTDRKGLDVPDTDRSCCNAYLYCA